MHLYRNLNQRMMNIKNNKPRGYYNPLGYFSLRNKYWRSTKVFMPEYLQII